MLLLVFKQFLFVVLPHFVRQVQRQHHLKHVVIAQLQQ
jgi:hypothetical protein